MFPAFIGPPPVGGGSGIQTVAACVLRHLLAERNPFLDDPKRDAYGLVDGVLAGFRQGCGGECMSDLTTEPERRRSSHLREDAATGGA